MVYFLSNLKLLFENSILHKNILVGISQSSGGMDPGVDEEESEFGSEDGLPLSGEHHPPPSQPVAADNISEQSSPDEEVAPPIKASVQPKGDRYINSMCLKQNLASILSNCISR